MNPLQRLLIRLGLDATLRDQAAELARACSDEVAERLGENVLGSVTEARGYLRARSATLIQRRVAEIHGLNMDARRELQELVVEQLTSKFSDRLTRRPVPHRRAA